MITCGIDIGKGKHAVAVIDESGRQLVRTRFHDNTKAGAERMLAELLRHAEPSQIHVGMESTGNYSDGSQSAFATAAAFAPRIQTAAHCHGRARSVASGVSEPTSSHGD